MLIFDYQQHRLPKSPEGRQYSIYRSYYPALNKDNELIAVGLTRAEAQAHCSDSRSSLDGQWFDFFVDELKDPEEGNEKWKEAFNLIGANIK